MRAVRAVSVTAVPAAEAAQAHARAAGLRYSSDEEPGIRRVRRGRGFSYYAPDESLITVPAERARLDALAVPPAYTDVWICADPVGHLQATGRDGRARKTYRYHEDWRRFRDTVKFAELEAFGDRLGRARDRNDACRRKRALTKERLLGAVFHLLDAHALRVGNEAYAEENDSYGATTLRHEHLRGGHVRFRAKGGREVDVALTDRRFLGLAKRLSDLPGQPLFQYRDDDGDLRRLTSCDVNEHLEEVFGAPVTAKQFRTWAGSLAAFEAGAAGAGVTEAVDAAAARLRNTPAVARKAYVHPAILDGIKDGTLPDEVAALRAKGGPRKRLTREETVFLRWLDGA